MNLSRRTALAALASSLLAQAQQDPPRGFVRRPWPKDKPTPPLDLALHEGKGARFNLATDGHGKVVLLNFWATWCPPCRDELPTMELLATLYEKRGLLIECVNQHETDAAIKNFLDQLPMSLPILRDADGLTSRAWGARVFPTSVLVGRDGRAVATIVGQVDWNGPEARRWIEALL
ncbi:TlpA disulfide reductase family protein [Pelomonas sp. KK5]|uniref:TlpA family protein disulfide reductase n=1 Tax=Pelomonas sp. KK5 TaxID=1855730 RepID=UPI001301E0BD|nr:TlpA disulfide reductase family protein [Pelomonas sp. KK5]